MPRDSQGNYTLPAGNPVITGTIIESGWANSTMPDLGLEVRNSLDRLGRGAMEGPLRLNPGDTIGAPDLAWGNDTTLGAYRESASTIAFVQNGTVIARLGPTGLFVEQPHFDTAGAGPEALCEVREGGQRVYSPNNPPPGSGTTTFIGLIDTPGTYVGEANKLLSVKATEDGVEFTTAPTGLGDVIQGGTGATGEMTAWLDWDAKTVQGTGFDASVIIRSDVTDQTVLTDFKAIMNGDATGAICVSRTAGDDAICIEHQASNALRGHVIARAGAAAPGGRSLFLQEGASRGVVIGEDQVTGAGTYADAGKDTLRVMGPIYESRVSDSVNHRVYSELFPPPIQSSSSARPTGKTFFVPDADFTFKVFDEREFDDASDTITLLTGSVANSKLVDMAASTIKMRVTAGTGVPEDATIASLTAHVPVTGDALLAQQSGGGLVKVDGAAFIPATLTADGDLLSYDGTQYTKLAVGLDGQTLVSRPGGAAGAKLVWETVAGGSSPLTTKGDVYTYDTGDARLGVGTDGQVLTADSAQATGLAWTTPAGTGDVVGPASAVDSNLAAFDTTTGKLIKDSLVPTATVVRTDASAVRDEGTGVAYATMATPATAPQTITPLAGGMQAVTGSGTLTVNLMTQSGASATLVGSSTTVALNAAYNVTPGAEDAGTGDRVLLTLAIITAGQDRYEAVFMNPEA